MTSHAEARRILADIRRLIAEADAAVRQGAPIDVEALPEAIQILNGILAELAPAERAELMEEAMSAANDLMTLDTRIRRTMETNAAVLADTEEGPSNGRDR